MAMPMPSAMSFHPVLKVEVDLRLLVLVVLKWKIVKVVVVNQV